MNILSGCVGFGQRAQVEMPLVSQALLEQTLVARDKVKNCYPILQRPVALTQRPAGLEEEG